MTANPPAVIAVLGLGEAGSEIAADLVAAGAVVHAYDPKVAAPAAVRGFGSDADAARGASVILALTSAHEAAQTLALALPGIGAGASYADLNTGSAGLKASLAQTAARAGVSFADVALMAPVPGAGLRTPMLASGRPPASTHAFSARSEPASRSFPARPERQPHASWCGASSTRDLLLPSPRRSGPAARRAVRNGSAATSVRFSRTRRLPPSTGLSTAASGTLGGGRTR